MRVIERRKGASSRGEVGHNLEWSDRDSVSFLVLTKAPSRCLKRQHSPSPMQA